METKPIYYLIFSKNNKENLGRFVCIVDRIEVAEDFCANNKDFYYLSNLDWEDML